MNTQITEAVLEIRETYLTKVREDNDFGDPEELDRVVQEMGEEFDLELAKYVRLMNRDAYTMGRQDERHDCSLYSLYQKGKMQEDVYLRNSRSRNPFEDR